jgi:biotin operon repressor
VAGEALRLLQEFRASGVPLSRKMLVKRLGCTDRALRLAIAQLRLQGHLVIADDDGGYRLARNRAEVEGFVGSLKSRIGELQRAVNAMEREAAVEFPGGAQMSMTF